jgi:hypothetical protein
MSAVVGTSGALRVALDQSNGCLSIRADAVRRWFVRATEATKTEVPKQETDP